MKGIFKKVMYIAIGLLIVIGLLTELVPTIATDAAALAADEDTPAIMALIVDYWWVGLTILFIGLVMSTNMGRRLLRRGRRRRSRR